MHTIYPHRRWHIVRTVHIGRIQRDVQLLRNAAEVYAIIARCVRPHEINFLAALHAQITALDAVPFILRYKDALIEHVSLSVEQINLGSVGNVGQKYAVVAADKSQAVRFEVHARRIAGDIKRVRAVAKSRIESLNRRLAVEDNIGIAAAHADEIGTCAAVNKCSRVCKNRIVAAATRESGIFLCD